MIQPERSTHLNNREVRRSGGFVLYWMQQAQRSEDNHALQYAIEQAKRLKLPVVVYLGLVDDYPGANLRHYDFMLRGLQETAALLRSRGMECVFHHGDMLHGVTKAAKDAALVVVDGGYTRIQRQWRQRAADALDCPLVQIESDVVVPVAHVSPKQEYAARTIRPKIHRLLGAFLLPLKQDDPARTSLGMDIGLPLFPETVEGLLSKLKVDRSIGPAPGFAPGSSAALSRLDDFVFTKLERYATDRNDPNLEATSGLSPYLHFGQISPLRVALAAHGSGAAGADAFVEELVVRRELAINYIYYNEAYDRFAALPQWAQNTLAKHAQDPREYLYGEEELRAADTHDPYWNAAQKQMMLTGHMQGYMRMYWGKKLLEWSPTPQAAFAAAIRFNDAYHLDGRDANGYTGVAWCFGLHDRPWKERSIFGTVRYMNDRGLRRKFDADAWVQKVATMEKEMPFYK